MREDSLPMQNKSYFNPANRAPLRSSPLKGTYAHPIKPIPAPPQAQARSYSPSVPHSKQSPPDVLAKVFNSALVATRAKTKRDFSAELHQLMDGASFKTILNAVRQLSCVQGISEQQAAEELVETFRKLDSLWDDYIYKEGVGRLRGQR
jgi:hypothetical protein